ncbi:MAG TPA: CHRD domain-containing protein [Gemmatimonadaceae bacterium]|nr:CHRD domain-containing protein [Gemmatimonadaceae bacterium]
MRRTVSTLALGLIAAVAVAAAATSCGSSSTAPTNKTYIATMLPGNETPPKTTTGTGVTTFVDNGTEIDWTMSLTGMTGVFASHIHLGAATVPGPVIFNLFIPNGTNTATLNGVVGSGSITNANNVNISLDSLRVLLNNGNAYVNVHTTANQAGEIRGQIAPK